MILFYFYKTSFNLNCLYHHEIGNKHEVCIYQYSIDSQKKGVNNHLLFLVHESTKYYL
jgi:hypothetical protein